MLTSRFYQNIRVVLFKSSTKISRLQRDSVVTESVVGDAATDSVFISMTVLLVKLKFPIQSIEGLPLQLSDSTGRNYAVE